MFFALTIAFSRLLPSFSDANATTEVDIVIHIANIRLNNCFLFNIKTAFQKLIDMI